MNAVAYRWDAATFLRAEGLGVFSGRVELVEGEVWPVVLGLWHGQVQARVVVALQGQGEVLTATLPTADSLPDPDVWVLRPGAQPVDQVSPRLPRWDAADVLLVVEVSDETVDADLGAKAALYARAGYVRYWVVTRDGVHDHGDPRDGAYASVRMAGVDATVAAPDGTTVAVRALLPVG